MDTATVAETLVRLFVLHWEQNQRRDRRDVVAGDIEHTGRLAQCLQGAKMDDDARVGDFARRIAKTIAQEQAPGLSTAGSTRS
jgi:hypothetical protein